MSTSPIPAQALADAAAAYTGGDWRAAETLCRTVLNQEAGNFEALNLLGIIKARTNHPGEAADLLKRAVAARPDNATVHNNYGNVLRSLGRFKEAVALYDRALLLQPGYPEAYNNRGGALRGLGDFAAALDSYDRSLKLRPADADTHYNRGLVLQELQRPEEALASYARALQLRPRFAHASYNQGLALHQLRRFADAVRSYDDALAAAPNFFEAANNRGNSLQELGRYEEALASYARALRDNPALADAYSNQGNALRQLDRPQDALASYARALQLDPRVNWLFGAWFDTKLQLCDWQGLDQAFVRIAGEVEQGTKVVQPFTVLSYSDLLPLQRRAAAIAAQEHYPLAQPLPPPPRRRSAQVIRIGYFSADFRLHATTQLMAGLIERHDRARFFVSGFSFGAHGRDEMTRRLERSFDHFVDVQASSDREVAELARQLEIDIAIDLKGFTHDCRPGIFAHRAAPLQVSYLGYPGTLGAPFIDYLIADATVIPPGERHEYTEKVLTLPHSYQINDSGRTAVPERFSRTELGLPQSAFVFCCLNSCFKINAATFAGWMRILSAVPGSVLWLLTDNRTAENNLRVEAERCSVRGERLIFAGKLALAEHLARYRAADLFLDTFPCGAHTTASDALWCGLPLLTRPGASFVSRVAASLLKAVNLPELIAASQSDYEALAIALATDPPRLAAIKGRLASGRATFPLFDTALTTRHLEAAYREIYERYQAGIAPVDLQIKAGSDP